MKWVATLGAAAVTLLGVRYLIKNTGAPHQGRRRAVPSVSSGEGVEEMGGEVVDLRGWKVVVGCDAVGKVVGGEWVVNENDLEILQTLHEECDLYFVQQVESDEEEEIITRGVTSLPFFTPFPTHRLLYCSSEVGLKAVFRQLLGRSHTTVAASPSLSLVTYLLPHVPHVCLVTPTPETSPVLATSDLTSYVALLKGD